MRTKFDTADDLTPVGYSAIVAAHKLTVMPHFRLSYLVSSGRGIEKQQGSQRIHAYPMTYQLRNPDSSLQQLEFALKHDGVNLQIIEQLFSLIPKDEIVRYIEEKPTGKYRRKIWFLYEFLLGGILDLPDLARTRYEDLLDPDQYYVVSGLKSKRHGINNNLLGPKDFCPVVRRTERLNNFEGKHLRRVAREILTSVDPAVLARATNYLYTKETKSSFGIERIKPSVKRASAFVSLLEQTVDMPRIEKPHLIALQNTIVDELYRDKDYRHTQNYVGDLDPFYQQRLHYISPKPTDIHRLMSGFLESMHYLMDSDMHPVVIASVLSFGFVFLHPFEDGNGRIHRFLIHYILSVMGYTPDNIIFPVSAVMLKNLKQYDQILETFSNRILQVVTEYDLSDDGVLTVNQDTQLFYQFVDYTKFAEYLFSCIESTIQEDFKEELDFIVNYDRAKSAIQAIIDMPDMKIDRIIRCITQNNGRLGSNVRRKIFAELSDEMVKEIEEVLVRVWSLER